MVLGKVVICFLVSSVMLCQSMYDTYNGFVVPTTPVLPMEEKHPSLMFSEGDIQRIRNLRNTDVYGKFLWNRISRVISKYKQMNPSLTNPSDRAKMAFVLAFAWVVDSDVVARDKALESLMRAYENVPRTASASSFSGDYDEIYRATWLQNFCAAYDWLYKVLDHRQDSIVRGRLIEEVLLLKENMVSGVRYAPRPHNHRSKPAWAIGTAALTLSSDPRAADWLRFALEQANTVTKYMFSADGIYREGGHYFIYSAVNFIPFLWQYKNVSGVDLFSYFKPAFEWSVKIRMSRGWLPNIEDSYLKPVPTHMVAKAYMDTPTELHSSEPLGKILQWAWFSTNVFEVNYTGATDDVVWEVYEYLTYEPGIQKVPPNSSPVVFLDGGQVIFRDNWVNCTRYLIFHGVAEADNHNHPDQLSYFIEANYSVLSPDAGYGKDGYSDSKRAWYTSPEAHNILTVNGNPPLDLGTNIKPRDSHFINIDRFAFSEKEALSILRDGRIIRGVAFIDNDYWIVYDIGYAREVGDYRLYLHGRGSMARDRNKIMWISPTDRYGFTAKLFTFILPSSSAFSDKSGYTSLFKDEEVQKYVEVYQRGDSVGFMHLLIPASVSEAYPNVEEIQGEGYIGVVYSYRGNNHIATLSVRSREKEVSGIVIDGVFSWMDVDTVGKVIRRFFINGGQRVSDMLFSNKPITTYGDFSGVTKKILYVDSTDGEVSIVVKTGVNLRYLKSIEADIDSIKYEILDDFRIKVQVRGPVLIKFLYDSLTTFVAQGGSVSDSFGLEVYPNPSNGQVFIQIKLRGDVRLVQLDIYDVLGRLVRSYSQSVKNGDLVKITWDGCDERGFELASGIYMVQVRSGHSSLFGKIILIK